MLRVYITLVAALVSLALGASAACAQPSARFTNPLYRQWAGFTEGASATFTDRVIEGGRQSEATITQRLVSLSPAKAVVEWTRETPGERVNRTPAVYPALTTVAEVNANAHIPWQTWGRNTAELQGRTVAVEWVRSVVDDGDERTTISAWRSDDAPGGVVKYTVRRTRDGRLVSSITRRLNGMTGVRVPGLLTRTLLDLAHRSLISPAPSSASVPTLAADSEAGFTATVSNTASQSVQVNLNTGSSYEPGNVSPTSCTVQPGGTCTITMNNTPCNSGTGHFDVFTANSSGSYTNEQNYFEIYTQMNAICGYPGQCDEYTTWAMSVHIGAGSNDLPTSVAVTGGSAADGCATPEGGTGSVTVRQ